MYYQALALGLLLVVSANLNAENPYTPEESLHIKEACIELGNRYAYYLDTGQNDKISDLFDEQGSWQSTAGKYTGREDIKLAFSRRPKNRRTIHEYVDRSQSLDKIRYSRQFTQVVIHALTDDFFTKLFVE